MNLLAWRSAAFKGLVWRTSLHFACCVLGKGINGMPLPLCS